MRTLFTFTILLLLFSETDAQEKESYKYSVSATAEYGFLIAHHAEMNRLSTRYFPTFRLYLGHRTTGSKEWHQKYHFPELGVGAYFSPLMFNEQLGQAYAVFGYLKQIIGKKDKNNWMFRFGLGPGLVSSKFDAVDNNQNTAIGTNLNIFVFFEFQKSFRIAKNTDLNFGINGSHFSNTGMQMPNLGINLLSGQVSLLYRIDNQKLDTDAIEAPEIKKITQEVLVLLGRKQSEIEKAKSTIINPRYQAYYRLSFKSNIVGSADMFFEVVDPYTYEFQKEDNSFQAGLAIGYLLNMEQFQVMLQWGFYLYNNSADYESFYHRLGFKWVVSDHLLVNISLRTEWARARNVEIGVGWRF